MIVVYHWLWFWDNKLIWLNFYLGCNVSAHCLVVLVVIPNERRKKVKDTVFFCWVCRSDVQIFRFLIATEKICNEIRNSLTFLLIFWLLRRFLWSFLIIASENTGKECGEHVFFLYWLWVLGSWFFYWLFWYRFFWRNWIVIDVRLNW